MYFQLQRQIWHPSPKGLDKVQIDPKVFRCYDLRISPEGFQCSKRTLKVYWIVQSNQMPEFAALKTIWVCLHLSLNHGVNYYRTTKTIGGVWQNSLLDNLCLF